MLGLFILACLISCIVRTSSTEEIVLYDKNASTGFEEWSAWEWIHNPDPNSRGQHNVTTRLHRGSDEKDQTFRSCSKNHQIWIVSEFISINPARKIWINMTLQIEYITTTVRLLYLNKDVSVPVADLNWNEFQEIAAGIEASNTSHSMEVANSKGIYFAISIPRSSQFMCITLKTFTVSYLQCSETWKNLAHFASTVAAGNDQIQTIVRGGCLRNAEPLDGSDGAFILCDAEGRATFKGGCQCQKGFGLKAEACRQCYLNFFKSSGGNSACKKCGKNTENTVSRTSCPCKLGTYRAIKNDKDSSKDCSDKSPFTTRMTFYIILGVAALFFISTVVSVIAVVILIRRRQRRRQVQGDQDPIINNDLHNNNDVNEAEDIIVGQRPPVPIPRPPQLQYENQPEDEDEGENYEPLH